jgi:hypothetical protein
MRLDRTLAALLGLVAVPAGAQTLSLSPAVVPLGGQPGQSTVQTLTLTNGTGLRLEFALEAQDVVVRDGRRVFVAAGEVPGSIAATAVFSERRLELGPGQAASVDVTVTLPASAAHRAVVVLFRGLTRIAGAGGSAATASLGTLLTFTLSDERSVSPSELTVEPPTAARNLAFEQAFANDGSEPVVLKGMTVILDGGGRVVGKVPARPQRLLPGERAALRGDFGGELSPGTYRALSTFEFDGRAVVRSAAFEVR